MIFRYLRMADLYGQAQGEEYTADDTRGTAGGTDGTGDSDGADQRRGMDEAHRSGAQNGGSVSGAVGAESDSVERGEQIYREDDEDSRGAERGDGDGSAQGDEGSNRTGWESERESFESYRQKNTSGRSDMVSPSRAHIVAYFESEEGKKSFAEWMEKKNALQNEKLVAQSKKDGE